MTPTAICVHIAGTYGISSQATEGGSTFQKVGFCSRPATGSTVGPFGEELLKDRRITMVRIASSEEKGDGSRPRLARYSVEEV